MIGLRLIGVAVGALYIAFGVGCVVASWHWSAAWTVVGLALFAAWLLVHRRVRRRL